MPYTTKQRLAILRVLERRGECLSTAPDLAEILRQEGSSVGLATIYRHLDRLSEGGYVHKIATESGSLYQYCARQAAGEECFLFRCNRCGRLEHLDCGQFREFYRHLFESHGFQVDPQQSILTGLCRRCAKRETLYGEN